MMQDPSSSHSLPQNHTTETVHVPLGGHAYDVIIGHGLLTRLPELISPLLRRPKTVIVTDQIVAGHYLATIVAHLQAAGIETDSIVLPQGEASKSFTALEYLTDQLLHYSVERADTIIALGGGVIGDLTGFAAAILRRGIDFIQIPTTLLAQVDSSVGGKTGINTRAGKNLIGAFHQPRLVIADTACLSSLDARQLRAGYGEVVKYGLIDDTAFLDWLFENGDKILACDPDALRYSVATSVRSKARIVGADEKEKGVRALLNLGHTFGHAVETLLGYDGRILHGEAVALGMVLALELSEDLHIAPTGSADMLKDHLRPKGFSLHLGDLPASLTADTLMRTMAQDKKVEHGEMIFILGAPGKAQICRDIDPLAVRHCLQRSLEKKS